MGLVRFMVVGVLACAGAVFGPLSAPASAYGTDTLSVTIQSPTVALGQTEVLDVQITCSSYGARPAVAVSVDHQWIQPVEQRGPNGDSVCGQPRPVEYLESFAAPTNAHQAQLEVEEAPSGSGSPAYPFYGTLTVTPPSLSLALNTATPVVGDRVTASGALSPCLNTDTPVTIQQQRASGWVDVASSTLPGCATGSSSYSAAFTATQTGPVRAVVSAGANSATSPQAALNPRTLVAPPGPVATSMAARLAQRKVHPGARLRVIGWVMPCSRGPVLLERRAGRRWKQVASETVSCAGDTSPATFTLRSRVRGVGIWRLQVVYDGHVVRLPRVRVVPRSQRVPKVVHVVLPPPPSAPPSAPPAPPPPM